MATDKWYKLGLFSPRELNVSHLAALNVWDGQAFFHQRTLCKWTAWAQLQVWTEGSELYLSFPTLYNCSAMTCLTQGSVSSPRCLRDHRKGPGPSRYIRLEATAHCPSSEESGGLEELQVLLALLFHCQVRIQGEICNIWASGEGTQVAMGLP